MSTTVLRVSSLSGYPDCPRRAAARLFRREIIEAGFRLRETLLGVGAAIGSAIHAGVAAGFSERAKGDTPPAAFPVEAAMANLKEATDQELLYDGPRGATFNRQAAEVQVRRMTSGYWEQVAPRVQPIQVEQRLEAGIAPGVILSGQPDLVCHEPHSIRDLKTGSHRGSHAPQLGGYSLLARSHAIRVDTVHIDWLKRVPVKSPQPPVEQHTFEIAAAETAAASIVRHIVADLTSFRKGDPARGLLPGDPWSFMANPNSTLCSRKFCPAFGTDFCHEGREEGTK